MYLTPHTPPALRARNRRFTESQVVVSGSNPACRSHPDGAEAV